MAKKLHIDIETYSSVDIKTSGAYKYTESVDFEILLIAYAFDSGPIKIVDLAQKEEMPLDFLEKLKNDKVEKWAHNAVFERLSFKAAGFDIPVEQWHCSAVKAAYCGLPLSLAGSTEALKLGKKGKLATGKALIRFFCCPVKPTKINGHKVRNFPAHDFAKWEDFKMYCINDVEAEREICAILDKYIFPASERANYLLDQEINDRGVEIDLTLARNAIDFDKRFKKRVTERLKDLTKLGNPNSPVQLKKWLGGIIGKEVVTLAKGRLTDTVEEARKVSSEALEKVEEAVECRIKLSKTSTKKYEAMENCACYDGKVHGAFQFYGARTGRWAGRLVQLHNLPQNHLAELEKVRELVASGEYDLTATLFGSIPQVLSELIRTAFVAKPQHTFAVADFSAIEARVLAWLAGEQWRLDVFNSHGKIYEASASMMFNVPIDQITKGSALRQQGKIAELALGYGGSVGAMAQMDKSGNIPEGDYPEIVKKWREANPETVNLWHSVNKAALRAVKTRKPVHVKCLVLDCDGQVLTIELPSGRKLFYQKPRITINKFGSEAVSYEGTDSQTRKWTVLDSYGGKWIEHIVQAIARDLLVHSMHLLRAEDYKICMHVHDEPICEVPLHQADADLKRMCLLMSDTPLWATGLPLVADGYITPFYKKD